MPSAESTPASRRGLGLARAATLLLAATTLANILALLGPWLWFLDLLSHFVVVYALTACTCLVIASLLRRWRLATWALLLALLQCVRLWPLYAGPQPGPARVDLRVVAFNVHAGNQQLGPATQHIASLEPDVIALFEVSTPQLDLFEAALPDYEVRSLCRDDPFGIAVLTRRPMIEPQIGSFGPEWVPAIRFTIDAGDRSIALAAIHPPPPIGSPLNQARNDVLHSVARWAERQSDPAIIIGDLNASPWSAIMRELLDDPNLHSSQRFGVQPSWPSWLGPMGLPIDHALHTSSVRVVDRRVGPSFGSDHRMLVVEFAVD